MARVSAPLLSLDASGTLAKAITFSKWKGRNYVRTRVIPANPRSGLQVGMRAGIKAAPPFWNALTPTELAKWAAGVGAEAISGFNLYTRNGQKSIRNDFGYFFTYDDQSQTTAVAAPAAPGAAQSGTDMTITWTHAVGAYQVLIFHGLTTGFTSGIASLIAIPATGLQTWTHRNPGIGTHYYDIRSGGPDGGVGALAGEFSAAIV